MYAFRVRLFISLSLEIDSGNQNDPHHFRRRIIEVHQMEQLKKQDSQSGEMLSQVTDAKLIEVSKVIFAEITGSHKLNERRINHLIDKNALICQNSFELERMFKVRRCLIVLTREPL